MKKMLMLLLGLPLAGCVVQSTAPWLDESTAVKESRLAGTWAATNQETTLVFGESDADGAFTALLVGKDLETMKFAMRLHQVGGILVLDAAPEKDVEEHIAVIPGHLLVRAELNGDELKLFPLHRLPEEAVLTAHGARKLAGRTSNDPPGVDAPADKMPKLAETVLADRSLFNDQPAYTLRRANR
jgi:hypothetical protein